MAAKKTTTAAAPTNSPVDLEAAWARVKPASTFESFDKIKALITGPSKSGKSHCASLFRKPLYGLTEKQAMITISRANPDVHVFLINTAADLFAFREMAKVAHEKGFDAVVLDSITDAQRILRNYYTSRQGAKAGRDKTSQESWGSIIDATARLAREFRDLPIHVCVIALDEEIVVEEEIRHRPLVSGKKLPNDLCQYFSVVGFVYVAKQDRGYRHQVMFRGDHHYLVGAPYWLDDTMPPEPQLWISRMTGDEVPPDVQARVDAWDALASPEAADSHDADASAADAE